MDCGIGEATKVCHSPDTASDAYNFDCHICFEPAHEPIVTLCGHLYCWPCLHQWLLHSHFHECPVCKGVVNEEKLIPIYGRGKTSCNPRSISIPRRPVGQRLEPARTEMSYIPSDEADPMGFMPMAIASIGHKALSTIFQTLPGIFNRF